MRTRSAQVHDRRDRGTGVHSNLAGTRARTGPAGHFRWCRHARYPPTYAAVGSRSTRTQAARIGVLRRAAPGRPRRRGRAPVAVAARVLGGGEGLEAVERPSAPATLRCSDVAGVLLHPARRPGRRGRAPAPMAPFTNAGPAWQPSRVGWSRDCARIGNRSWRRRMIASAIATESSLRHSGHPARQRSDRVAGAAGWRTAWGRVSCAGAGRFVPGGTAGRGGPGRVERPGG
jgi:hypothetical protein